MEKSTQPNPPGPVTLGELFSAFFRIGLFTFGGGYAMLPLIEKEVIDRKAWTDNDEILNIYALAQSVPGVIAINTAIFLGNRLRGLSGAVTAAAGVIAPSIIVIVTIAMFFAQLQTNAYVLQAFSGVRAAVVGLVAAAALRIAIAACKDKPAKIIGIIAFGLGIFTDVHPAWLIVGGGMAGFVIYRSSSGGKHSDPA